MSTRRVVEPSLKLSVGNLIAAFPNGNHSSVSNIAQGERSGAVAPLAARGDRRHGNQRITEAASEARRKKTMLRIG